MTHSQRRFLAQYTVAMLEQCCKHLKQCRNNVATLCNAKNRRCESSRHHLYGGRGHTTTNFPSSFWASIKSLRIQLQEKSKVWKNANSFFYRRFHCRGRGPCLRSLMTTCMAEGLEGVRQERLVHLFCAPFVAKYLKKRRDCLQSLKAWRKKIWVWTW